MIDWRVGKICKLLRSALTYVNTCSAPMQVLTPWHHLTPLRASSSTYIATSIGSFLGIPLSATSSTSHCPHNTCQKQHRNWDHHPSQASQRQPYLAQYPLPHPKKSNYTAQQQHEARSSLLLSHALAFTTCISSSSDTSSTLLLSAQRHSARFFH